MHKPVPLDFCDDAGEDDFRDSCVGIDLGLDFIGFCSYSSNPDFSVDDVAVSADAFDEAADRLAIGALYAAIIDSSSGDNLDVYFRAQLGERAMDSFALSLR